MNGPTIHSPGARASLLFAASAVVYLVVGCSGFRPSAKDQERAARLFNVGVAQMAEARFAEAQALFDSARTLAPGEPCYVLAAGQARMNQAKYDSARVLFEQSVAIDSTLREGWYALGFLAIRQGRNEDALAALAHCPDDPASQYLMGVARNRLDQPTAAEEHFRRSIALDHHFISAHYALAQLLQRQGDEVRGRKALARFTYLKNHGGTNIDLGGDIGTKSQGRLAETPIPDWRKRPIAEERTAPLTIRKKAVTWPSDEANTSRTWVAARIVDLDGDGRDDLALAAEDGVRLWRNEGDATFRDITAEAGLPDRFESGGGITNIAFGDADGDGRPELVVTQWGASSLWKHITDSLKIAFERDTVALPPALSATWADEDHDGLLDLILVPLAAHHGPGPVLGLSLWRNRGDGTFADYSDSAGVSEPALAGHFDGRGGVTEVVAADWDQDWDTDLLLCFQYGAPVWLENQHDGRFVSADGTPAFEAVALPAHLGADTAQGLATSAAVGDFVPNGWLDVVTGGAHGLSTVATISARHQLPSDTFPLQGGELTDNWRVRLADVDLDGDLDLLSFLPGSERIRLAVNQGTGIQWDDRTADLTNAIPPSAFSPVADVEIGALDEKNEVEMLLLPRSGQPVLAEVQPVGRGARIRLVGGRSAREGIGAVVDIAQGYRWQRRLLSCNGAGGSGRDLLVGLPRVSHGDPIDMIRVTWTSGIRQSVIRPSPDTLITIVEKPGETSSCPFVYAWNGERFEFIADAIGNGVVGVVVDPPETYNQPDPDEYLLVRGDQLVPRDGALRVRVMEALNEATLVDNVRLLAVAHPREAEIYPAEKMPMESDPPKFAIYRVTNARPIRRAWETDGHEVTELLREKDRKFVLPGPMLPYLGFGTPHTLTLDLGDLPRGGPIALVWDGWTNFWNSTSVAQAANDGIEMVIPRLDIPDGKGGWKTIIADLGVPAGKPRTILTDLTGKLPPGVHTVRLVTNLLVYWDRVRLTTDPLDRAPVRVEQLPIRTADVRFLGHPQPFTPDGGEPYIYDYGNLSADAPWPTLPGRYTRYGPVRPLLEKTDDRFVIIRHGDEIAITFPEPTPAREGWTTDYLIYLNGYMKETIPVDPVLSRLDPLPYHEMPRYPYAAPAKYPDDSAHRAYQEKYNTRMLGER